MAKLISSQTAERAASMAIEFCGGVGFTKEYPLEKFYRDAKIGQIYEGTSNMQRMTIAKQLVAEYSRKA
jgi:butyryl-CoA dehydrogenase/short/branched chain acyl-CoA dehydrogenase